MHMIAAHPTAPPIPDCPEQQPGETAQAYQGRILQYALRHGIGLLSPSQWEACDTAAQHAVCRLAPRLTVTDHHLDRQLSALRHRIAARMAHRRATLARLDAMIADLYQEAPRQGDAPGGPQQPQEAPESDADRAAKLLRAALTLIMGQGGQDGQGGGGRGARLIRPVPKLPPGGAAVRIPINPARTRDDDDGIGF